MLDQLWGHFRKYWPKPATKLAKTDDYQLPEPEQDESQPVEEEQFDPDQGVEPNDTELAMALGAPNACVARMTPTKSPARSVESSAAIRVSDSPADGIKAVSCAAAARERRIAELQFLAYL